MVDWNRLIPLLLFFVFFSVVGVVLWIVYTIMMDVKAETKGRMKENNVILSRKGVTVELQELSDEAYRDKHQSILVSIWNAGPAYKHRILWGRRRNGSPSRSSGTSRNASRERKRSKASLIED